MANVHDLEPNLRELIRTLPDSPGVYLMKNAAGDILYVGKAVNLKNRVRQYFRPSGHDGKTAAMVRRVATFEIIRTHTELEALMLECTLIKQHRPHYNILLKDDKSYPYIRVDMQKPYPRVEVVRRKQADGARYFGPFISSLALRETLDIVALLFPLRTCKRDIPRSIQKGERPCLNYQIGRCIGPCTGQVTPRQYGEMMAKVLEFFEGKRSDVRAQLVQRMQACADALEFEQAARLRDGIAAIDRVAERQDTVHVKEEDRDIFALVQDEGDVLVQGVYFRGGRLVGTQTHWLQWEGVESAAQLMGGFLQQHYLELPMLPRDILLSHAPEDQALLEQYLRELRGGAVHLSVPVRGEKKRLVELAVDNAGQALERLRAKARQDYQRHEGAVEKLAQVLGLPAPPVRIECYDNSNIQGSDPVASMVVFVNGRPARNAYRRFRIKTVEGADDFATMQEVLTRRLTRWQKGDAGWSDTPGLLVVDGGKGQLSAACEALDKLGVDIPVVGLAKRMEEIFLPHREHPLLLRRNAPELHLLQRLRDEAHRFAIEYHRKRRDARTLHSALEDIPGVGAKRRQALLAQLGSVKRVKEATLEELLAVPGIDARTANNIWEHFHKESEG